MVRKLTHIEKIDRLLEIYSIPIAENWEGYCSMNDYSVYTYWKNLNIINEDEFSSIFKSKQLRFGRIFSDYFRHLDYHFKPDYYVGESVADVGSGFGFITFWLVLSGAQRVYAIGDPKRIEFIEMLYERAVQKMLIPENSIFTRSGFIREGDSSLAENIGEDSLNLVLLNDTMEHIIPRYLPFLAKSAHYNLKPGGMLISKQQNTSSKKMKSKLMVLWDKYEKEVFFLQRLSLIKQYIEGIDENKATELARVTRGLDSVDFYSFLDDFKVNNVLPVRDLDVPPINILEDECFEGDTDINRIKSEFRNNNFQVKKVYPDLLSSKRSRYFQGTAKLFPGLFFGLGLFDQTSVFVFKKSNLD